MEAAVSFFSQRSIMTALVLLVPIIGGAALFGLSWWLERVTRRPGLSFIIGGVLLLVGAALGFTNGDWLLPLMFAVQAIGFFYHA